MSSLFTFSQFGLLSADNESDNNVLLSRFCVSRDTLSIICDVTGVKAYVNNLKAFSRMALKSTRGSIK